MRNCKNYSTFSAPLCPLDPDISLRSWMVGEEVCSNKDYKDQPWVLRQRKLIRTNPATLMDQPLSLDYLTRTAPKKRTLSEEHRRKLLEASKVHRFTQRRTTESN